MKVLVRVTLVVELNLDESYRENLDWTIEENSCPGTGVVGSAIDSAIAYGKDNCFCWACNLKGENKIISIDGAENFKD